MRRRSRGGGARLRRGGEGTEADVDVIPRFGRGQRVGGARVLHQADDLVRHEFSAQREQRADGDVGDRARALTPGDGDAVDRGDVERVARHGHRAQAGGGGLGVGAAQTAHGRLQAAAREEREHRQQAAVDRAEGDRLTAAGVDADAGIGEHLARSSKTICGVLAARRAKSAPATASLRTSTARNSTSSGRFSGMKLSIRCMLMLLIMIEAGAASGQRCRCWITSER